MAKKKPTKKASKSKSSKGSRESNYIDSLDLRSMWESFSLDTADNGLLKFKTVWQFITKFTKVVWQRELLYWLLGPVVEDNAASQHKSFTQLDFEGRRTKGHWFASSNIEKLSRSLNQKDNALQKIAELGQINIDVIDRLRKVAHQIDVEFSAGIMLPTLTQKENALRSQLYMTLQQQLMNLMEQAQLIYGKTQGVDLQQLNTFLTMFASGMGQTAGIGAALNLLPASRAADKSGVRDVAAQLIDMVNAKAVAFELDMPTREMEATVIDAGKPKLVRTK